jgi:hypothetical protein
MQEFTIKKKRVQDSKSTVGIIGNVVYQIDGTDGVYESLHDLLCDINPEYKKKPFAEQMEAWMIIDKELTDNGNSINLFILESSKIKSLKKKKPKLNNTLFIVLKRRKKDFVYDIIVFDAFEKLGKIKIGQISESVIFQKYSSYDTRDLLKMHILQLIRRVSSKNNKLRSLLEKDPEFRFIRLDV